MQELSGQISDKLREKFARTDRVWSPKSNREEDTLPISTPHEGADLGGRNK